MKRSRIMLLAVLGVLGMVSGVPAATDYQQQTIDQTMRREAVIDYGRQRLKDNELSQRPPDPSRRLYENEQRVIAGQMQVISENEDTRTIVVPGDTLTIAYQDRDHAERAGYKVSEQGDVFIPLLGPVRVAGLNRRQTRERLDAMLREYIRAPQTTVTVNTDGRMMIFGAVSLPGIYEVKNRITVMEAILSAGGFDRKTAELASVIVIRGTAEKPQMIRLNLKKMVQRGDRTDDIPVKPGDFIYVPTSLISNLESFWQTAYGYIMQWYGLGGVAPIDGRDFNW